MDRMLVVIFDDETKAYEGKKALMDLDREGSLDVYTDAVVAKNADGTMTVKEADDYDGPAGVLFGTALGSLVGLLGGPLGVAIGLVTGGVAGAAFDLNHARLGSDFVEDVSKALAPNKFALIAEIEENCTTPLDTRMEAIGGTVLRRSLSEVKHTLQEEHVAAMKADLAQMKAEESQAHAGRKAKLQEKIKQLDSRIQDQLQKANERREAGEREAQTKAKVLKEKAAAKTKAS